MWAGIDLLYHNHHNCLNLWTTAYSALLPVIQFGELPNVLYSYNYMSWNDRIPLGP